MRSHASLFNQLALLAGTVIISHTFQLLLVRSPVQCVPVLVFVFLSFNPAAAGVLLGWSQCGFVSGSRVKSVKNIHGSQKINSLVILKFIFTCKLTFWVFSEIFWLHWKNWYKIMANASIQAYPRRLQLTLGERQRWVDSIKELT